ncbi:MAG: hypothetical protein K2W95_13690 [Candidatus Obscuribacterales bacterium]|nr:hypothetical protein [Candidatus Obscuribacterales bacterium]
MDFKLTDATSKSPALQTDAVERLRAEGLRAPCPSLSAAHREPKSFVEEFKEFASLFEPGAGALTTRLAYLGLRGDLHTTPGRITREFAALRSPMGVQLADRVAEMKADGWRVWETARNGSSAGLYDPGTREITYRRPISIVPYILGASSEHPRQALVPLVAHEVGHHDALKHFPESFLKGQSTERIAAFRSLAYETNALMTEAHVDQVRGTAYSAEVIESVKSQKLGAYIHEKWYRTYDALKQISKAEATTFVNEYIAERWGEPLDGTGRVKPFSLNPTPLQALAESTRYDPLRLEALTIDYKAERMLDGSQTERYRFMRACQTGLGSTAVHGLKIFGTLGLAGAVHSVKYSFNESTGEGVGQLAHVGIGFGGFEAGTLLARCGSSAPIGRALIFGFIGAYTADQLVGKHVKRGLKGILT